MRRSFSLAVLALALGGMTLPASAAPKTVTFYFTNTGCANGTSPSLTTQAVEGDECTSIVLGDVQPFAATTYASTRRAPKMRIDAARPITGAIKIVHNPLVNSASDPVRMPGYVQAQVTIRVGSTRVGVVDVEGVTPPQDALVKTFSFPVPAALKGKTATKVSAEVVWETCTGLCAIAMRNPHLNTIVVPTR